MTRRLPLVVGLFFAASATAPAGADTPTIPPDYLCKPQQTATLSAGAQTATTPLDYLCKPQPATAPGGADTATIPRDYQCKPQPTATGGAETATAPLDYLCKPQPATVSAPAEEQHAENAGPADVTPHPENDTAEVAAPAAPAPPAKTRVGEPLPTIEDLPQYKFARSVEKSPVAGGNAESRYLTILYGMIKQHLHESPDLRLDLANKHGIVDFYVDQGGNLTGRKLVASSGSPNLDSAAMTAIAAAAPYPAPPNWRPVSLNYNFGKSAQLNTDVSATAAPAPIVPSVPPPAVGQPATAPASADTATAPASADTATAPASADTATAPATPTHRFNQVGVADNTLIIGHFASANPDCTSSGKTFVRVSHPPNHGGVTMREGFGFSYFENKPQCNSTKLSGVTVDYLPEGGFTGSDEFVLDVINQTGYEALVTYSLTIK
jgi:TonB family protein